MTPSPALPDFSLLASLALLRKGAADYYGALLGVDDETVRFGAMYQLLATRTLHASRYASVPDFCRHSSIKRRAFEFFTEQSAFDLAEAVAATPAEEMDGTLTASMRAELSGDYDAAQQAGLRLYFHSGELSDLVRVARHGEHAGGWRESVPWYVRAVAIAPLDQGAQFRLFRALALGNQFEAVETLAAILAGAGLQSFARGVYVAVAELAKGETDKSLRSLQALRPPEGMKAVRAYAQQLIGEAQDKLGNYRAAHAAFAEMNRLEVTPSIDPRQAIATATRLGAIQVPSLPPLVRDDVVMLVGFARSGTTLLELALGAHEDVEAFEEPPTWDAAMGYLERSYRSGEAGKVEPIEFFGRVRQRYYDEVARLRRKPDARLVVDKYPMRSIQAALLEKLLPQQRYLFAIRHPFDVVLSCFRQRFGANPAMEAFRDFGMALEMYDFVMSQWFAVHGLDDPRVAYVKYDDLVGDFEATMSRVLGFVGVDWSEGVNAFAQSADERAPLTPSYQKIRRGLSVGVQTSWRNYGFLFEGKPASLVRKWAEFFGYPTS